MKDKSVIPFGSYCYQLINIEKGEILADAIERFGKDLREFSYSHTLKEILCPYWRMTDYGMVLCEYLDVQCLDEDDPDARSKALLHFGSEAALASLNRPSLLYDEIKICDINVDE